MWKLHKVVVPFRRIRFDDCVTSGVVRLPRGNIRLEASEVAKDQHKEQNQESGYTLESRIRRQIPKQRWWDQSACTKDLILEGTIKVRPDTKSFLSRHFSVDESFILVPGASERSRKFR